MAQLPNATIKARAVAITKAADPNAEAKGVGIHGPLPEHSAQFLRAGGEVNGWGWRLRSYSPPKPVGQQRATRSLFFFVFKMKAYHKAPESFDLFEKEVTDVADAFSEAKYFQLPDDPSSKLLGITHRGLQLQRIDRYVQTALGAVHLVEAVIQVDEEFAC